MVLSVGLQVVSLRTVFDYFTCRLYLLFMLRSTALPTVFYSHCLTFWLRSGISVMFRMPQRAFDVTFKILNSLTGLLKRSPPKVSDLKNRITVQFHNKTQHYPLAKTGRLFLTSSTGSMENPAAALFDKENLLYFTSLILYFLCFT